MDKKTFIRRAVIALSGGIFAALMSYQSDMANRNAAHLVAGLAGIFAGLALAGLASEGRRSAGTR